MKLFGRDTSLRDWLRGLIPHKHQPLFTVYYPEGLDPTSTHYKLYKKFESALSTAYHDPEIRGLKHNRILKACSKAEVQTMLGLRPFAHEQGKDIVWCYTFVIDQATNCKWVELKRFTGDTLEQLQGNEREALQCAKTSWILENQTDVERKIMERLQLANLAGFEKDVESLNELETQTLDPLCRKMFDNFSSKDPNWLVEYFGFTCEVDAIILAISKLKKKRLALYIATL